MPPLSFVPHELRNNSWRRSRAAWEQSAVENMNAVESAKMCLSAFATGPARVVAAHEPASHSKFPASLNDELQSNREHRKPTNTKGTEAKFTLRFTLCVVFPTPV
ncbi:hypothetical protein EYF80_031924 [Liparis tanakae]|uniref:Uncharacterized protein n=1 Tax=Liparis tanakae TaxID=230148 RepID=A0A4Z2GYV8_9TELE|nr:hypothetical protein EYF80_031924 [Liparis tanakae]